MPIINPDHESLSYIKSKLNTVVNFFKFNLLNIYNSRWFWAGLPAEVHSDEARPYNAFI